MRSKYEKMIEELKRNAQADKDHLSREFKKKIDQLEADLKEARKGFENERQILEKKREDMKADYER